MTESLVKFGITIGAVLGVYGVIFGFGRVYNLIVPKVDGQIRPWPIWFGVGVLFILCGAILFVGALVSVRAGHSRAFVGLSWATAVAGIAGALPMHFALTVRTELQLGRIVFRRWLRPTLDVAISDIVKADIDLFSNRYRMYLMGGGQVGVSASSDGIWTLHNALKVAGKTIPDDAALEKAILRARTV